MKCSIILVAYSLAIASASTPIEDRHDFGAQLDLTDESDTNKESEMTHFELPKDLVPQSYVLHVEPNLEKATFDGQVSITVQVGSRYR